MRGLPVTSQGNLVESTSDRFHFFRQAGGRDLTDGTDFVEGGHTLLHPSLPSLATAVFACWPEAALRQLQKTDCLNLKGYTLLCRANQVFKFGTQIKKLDGDFDNADF